MKNFIKDILLFVVLMTFLTMMFQSIGNSSTNNFQNNISSNIDLIEGEISNGNQVNDGYLQEEKPEQKNNSNFLAKIVNGLGEIFTQAINLFIKLIMGIVQTFLGS